MIPTKIGIKVTCDECGHMKQPHGRSAAIGSCYCSTDCDCYYEIPKPGCLWPGETDADFGYPCCDHATRPMTAEEIAEWLKEKEET